MEKTLRYRHACLSTLPLPRVLELCKALPDGLKESRFKLRSNRVVMVYLAIRGPRPSAGHWRYYGDEALCFTRLVFMHAFDPGTAPDDGWGLMAEIPEKSEAPLGQLTGRIDRAVEDARQVGALGEEHEVVASDVRAFDPAYVAFTHESLPVMGAARELLRSHKVTPLGRYGRWEYSSMAQVMRDGFSWGKRIADELGHVAPDTVRWTAKLLVSLPTESAVTHVAQVLLIALVPIFELVFITTVRIKKGLSWLKGSPDHFSLRLQQAGWSRLRVDFVAWAVMGATGVLGFLLPRFSMSVQAFTVLLVVLFCLSAAKFLLRFEVVRHG